VAARRCGVTGPNRYRGTAPAAPRADEPARGAIAQGSEGGQQLRLL
jgi:hypothetical protein